MYITRFTANDLHGYLQFDLKFKRNLNFITGINGSGKTTVVHSIVSLITPSLRTLGNITFSKMVLKMRDGNDYTTITATQIDGTVSLSMSGIDSQYSYTPFLFDPDEEWKQREREGEYYQILETRGTDNPLLQAIQHLPTPMFLNLDRRVAGLSTRRAQYGKLRSQRRPRNVFGISLRQSLADANALAERASRLVITRQARLSQQLRQKIILDALSMPTTNPKSRFEFADPTKQDEQALRDLEMQIPRISQILDLSVNDVENRFQPYINHLKKTIKQISKSGISINDILDGNSNDIEIEILAGHLDWSHRKPLFDRTISMLRHLDWYDKENRSLEENLNKYLELANRFLTDSGKELIFSENGNLEVMFHDKVTRELDSLSSGESQIVVIITHLAFNPAAQNANVFIIDEPELSLHVQWQDIFVETLQELNPLIQFLFATHSPSIIANQRGACIDLSKENLLG